MTFLIKEGYALLTKRCNRGTIKSGERKALSDEKDFYKKKDSAQKNAAADAQRPAGDDEVPQGSSPFDQVEAEWPRFHGSIDKGPSV